VTSLKNISHIRPLDHTRDLEAVADLLAEAFAGELDWAGERAVREMRLLGRWGGWLGWLDNAFFPNAGIGPGYVWVHQQCIVGHVSLRRDGYSSHWLIGNVAVAAARRGQGIGRALMQAAITHIKRELGESISLLVRADNRPAVHLYTALGLRPTCALAYWRRPRRNRAAPLPPAASPLPLRPARASDEQAVYDLARVAHPAAVHWAEPVRRADFTLGWERQVDNWLSGRRQTCWVAESESNVVGAVWALAPRPPEEGQLRMWTSAAYRGKLELALARAALDAVGPPAPEFVCAFPAQDTLRYVSLAHLGFVPI
jgi:ribosomal protein S18 acetylase RimI-like enzyme